MALEVLLKALLGVLVVMVLVWFTCIRRLAAQLRERHAKKADDLEVEDIFPADLATWIEGFDNTGPVMALLGFLWRRDYRRLRDARLTRLGNFMRSLLVAYAVVFTVTFVGITWHVLDDDHSPAAADAAPGTPESEADAAHRRGYEHRLAGRLDEALAEYRRLMDLAPGNVDAYRGSNTILLAQKRYADCLDLWNRYLRVFPGDAEGLHERSRAHYLLGDRAAALDDARRACAAGKAEACAIAERITARQGPDK